MKALIDEAFYSGMEHFQHSKARKKRQTREENRIPFIKSLFGTSALPPLRPRRSASINKWSD